MVHSGKLFYDLSSCFCVLYCNCNVIYSDLRVLSEYLIEYITSLSLNKLLALLPPWVFLSYLFYSIRELLYCSRTPDFLALLKGFLISFVPDLHSTRVHSSLVYGRSWDNNRGTKEFLLPTLGPLNPLFGNSVGLNKLIGLSCMLQSSCIGRSDRI